MKPKGLKKILKKKTTMLIITAMILLNILTFSPVTASYTGDNTKIRAGEIIEKRGEFEKYFQNEDGTITVATYADPIHYKNASGEWVNIDNTFIETVPSNAQENNQTKTYRNNSSSFNVALSEKANSDELVTIEVDGYKLSWKLNNTYNVNSVINNGADEGKEFTQTDLNNLTSEAIYKNALDNSDLRYTLSFKSLKEEIILNKVPTFDNIMYTINAKNLKAKLDENNNVIFYDAHDESKEIFKISAPFAYDSSKTPKYNTNIKVKLEETENGYIVTNNLDMEWLRDSDRVYPVIIDPTVTSSQTQTNIADSYVNSGSPNTNYVMSNKLVIGKNSGTNRAFIKIHTMPSIPAGSTITNATLSTNLYSGTSTWGTLSIYRLNSAWDSYTVTWNNHSSIGSTLLSTGITPSYISPYYRYNINVTSTVANWYANGMSNNWGFMLRYDNESYNDYNWLYSSDSGVGSTYKPAITITYDAPNKYAFSIGTTYSGNYTGDFSIEAELAYNQYTAMGYDSKLIEIPTFTNIQEGNYDAPPTRYWLESDVLFLMGHSNYSTMYFNYLDYSGPEYNIELKNDTSWTYSSLEGLSRLGIGRFDMNKVNFAMFMGCNTANLDYSNNLAAYTYNIGANTTLGWTSTIYQADTYNWLTNFLNRLSAGYTVQQSVTYANGFDYAFLEMRNTKIYGNEGVILNSITSPVTEVASLDSNYKREYVMDEITATKEGDLEKSIGNIIKQEVNSQFDDKDYIVEISEMGFNDKITKIYNYKFTINGIKTNLGYTVYTNEDSSRVTQIFDNMQSNKVKDIKLKSESITNRSNSISSKTIDTLRSKALKKPVSMSEDNNNHISKRNIVSEFKYYDVKEDKLYYYVNVEETFQNGTMQVLTYKEELK